MNNNNDHDEKRTKWKSEKNVHKVFALSHSIVAKNRDENDDDDNDDEEEEKREKKWNSSTSSLTA